MATLLDREASWSTDPDNCVLPPDWKIKICVGETEHDTYYVHKFPFTREPNRSGYFSNLFTGSQEYKESETNTSTIDLPNDAAANAFRILLDIVYGKAVTVNDLSPEKSVALHHLLDLFIVDSQFTGSIEHSWEESVKGEDCGQWYVYADQFGNDKLMAMVVQKCADNLDNVKLDSLIIQVSNAKFWLDVNVSSKWHPGVARLVAEFCILHKDQDQLDADTFNKLAETLRWYSRELFETCLKLMQVEKAVDSHGGESELTGLQETCARYMSIDWRCVLEDNSIQESLQEIGPHVYESAKDACLKRLLCEHETFQDFIDSPNPGSLPTSITVAGAEIPEVNGVYVRANPFGDSDSIFDQDNPVYAKDEIEIFYGMTGHFESVLWLIVRVEQDAEEDLYAVPPFAGKVSKFPPKTGWYSYTYGQSFPTLTYNW